MKFNSKYVAWLLPSLIGGALSYSTSLLAATEVTSIAFKGGEKSSVIEIMGSGPLTFTKQENSADKQIVIDLTDATLGKTVARKLDTSSFNSKVSLISPYQVDGKPADSRIVIQLRDFVSADVTTEGNLLKISVPNSTPPVKSAAAANPAPVTSESSNTAPGDLAQVPVPDAEKMADNTSPETRIREKKVDEGSVPKSDKLDDFISSRASRRFIGKPITLQVRDAEVADVLRLIGDSSGFNIILSDEVYEHLIFDDIPHLSILRYPDLAERSFVCFSFGKVYHCTGWKLGYCVSNSQLMKEFRKVHQFNCFSCNTPAQVALSQYLRVKESYASLGKMLQNKRDYFERLMKQTSFTSLPSYGSYFQLYKYDKISDEADINFAVRITKQYGVACIPVSAFYKSATDNKVVRFCFAKKEETLEHAVAKLSLVY